MSALKKITGWFLPHRSDSRLSRVSWRRVGGVSAVLMVAAYFSVTTAAFLFLREFRNIAAVQWSDVSLPWRWSRYRVIRGEQQIATARHLIKESRWGEALLHLNVGVASAPAHRDGRLLQFELQAAAGQGAAARATLLGGLMYHAKDPVFVRPVLSYLLGLQEDAHVVALAQRHLADPALSEAAARWYAWAAATAGHLRGNYDQAEDFLRQVPRLMDSAEGRLLAIRIEQARGYGDLALVRLRQLAAEFPHDAEVAQELVRFLRLRGLAAEARRVNLVFQIAHPTLAGPRVALLRAYQEEGETARVAQEVESLLRDFSADREALLRLADFGAGIGDVSLVRRIAEQAEVRRWSTPAFATLVVEAALVAKDYAGALAATRHHLAGGAEWISHSRAVFDSLQAIAHFGLGDRTGTRLSLDSFLTQPDLRAENLLAVANRFAVLNGPEQAWQTLARAFEVDPLNQAAVARLIELDLELGRMADLARHMRHFVKMRQPSPDVLRVVHYKLGSDLWMFSPEVPEILQTVRSTLERVEGRSTETRE